MAAGRWRSSSPALEKLKLLLQMVVAVAIIIGGGLVVGTSFGEIMPVHPHGDGVGLEVGFYRETCPMVEDIVRAEMVSIIAHAPTLAAAILRLHFHDCFVRGCDASVLLSSTGTHGGAGNMAERDAPPNRSLRGFVSVQRVKSRLEAACPSTVSCADILALMARDAVVLASGPYWPVPLGRRDGRVSCAAEAAAELPPSYGAIPQLAAMFAAKGLDLKDLAVLSGAHTIGIAHCPSYAHRLYNFTAAGDADPSLDRNYAARLRTRCANNHHHDDGIISESEMDPGSRMTFDSSYYRHVAKRRGLFTSDAALLDDAVTGEYVRRVATGKFDDDFFRDFAESMIKMGNVGVLTGEQGEIRNKCHLLN